MNLPSARELQIVLYLHRNPGANTEELANLLMVARKHVSIYMSRLRAKKLIEPNLLPHRMRVKYNLSEQGRELVEYLRKTIT